MELVEESGGIPERTIISHIDRTITEVPALLRLVETGCVIEFDFFGIESSYYPFQPTMDLPNDGIRLSMIKALIDHGFGSQVVISQDICTRTRLRRYGGHGYSHIARNVVPLMRIKGYSDEDIDGILVENPKRWLSVDEVL
jgi:phosphotriesterase-related protein